MNTFRLHAALSALLGSLILAPGVHAEVVNGTFAQGLTGWQTFGDVAANQHTLTLTTATLGADDFPFADGHHNVSGQSAGRVGEPGGLEDFLALPMGALESDPINHTVTQFEGSAARQTFSVQAGDTLRFDWNLLSADRDFADQALVVIDTHGANPFAFFLLADASQANQAVMGSIDLLQTGQHQFSHTFASAATVSLSFAVIDVQAPDLSTLLNVSDVNITAAVPEPASIALALVGFGLLGWRNRKA